MMLPEKTFRTVKHMFSRAETDIISKEIARKILQQKQFELEKKAATSEFAAKINQVTAELRDLADCLSNGYEFRETECEIHYDYDNNKKYYIAPGVIEPVGEDPLTADERKILKQNPLPGM